MSHRHGQNAPACTLPDSCELEPRFEGTWASERQERKAERFAGFSTNAQRRADDAHRTSRAIMDQIPFGQPILRGHHSQRRHEKALDRAWNLIGTAVHEQARADEWERRADAAANDTSISRNDPDAIEKCRERIEALEWRRDRMKELNALLRTRPADIYMTPREAADWLSWLHAFHRYDGGARFKGYDLSNIGANIRRYQQRLAEFERNAATAEAGGGWGRRMPNRWAGACSGCGASVAAQAGVAAKPARGPWEVFCAGCAAERSLTCLATA